MPHPKAGTSRSIVRVEQAEVAGEWRPASGKVWLIVAGPMDDRHLGDEIEWIGWLRAPEGPSNPGGFDTRSFLRDQRIRAIVHVRQTSDVVVRWRPAVSWNLWAHLARLRAWGRHTCLERLPPKLGSLAAALLLGETAALDSHDWEKYILTGVIHVLAISGQHLIILGAFTGWALRRCGVRRRPTAGIVAGLLLGYALLTGFRPPVQRAAVAAVVYAASVWLVRLPLPANTFALAWLLVIALNPTDIFQLGCQLSFLQVAVLIWGIERIFTGKETDPLDRLEDQFRPKWDRWGRVLLRPIAQSYVITAILGLVALPLVLHRQNVVSLSGFLIGPPLIALSSVALGSGFAMLAFAPFGLADLPTWVMRTSLALCEALVEWGHDPRWGYRYLASPPEWWLWGFYLGLGVWLWRRPGRWRPSAWLGLGMFWLALGLVIPPVRTSDELRITFLAVGHGCCTVIETPDGRVLVYDAGSMNGPETTRQHIAPFLWSRGHHRVDDLFLSHADQDHLNGVAELLQRFTVGRVHITPSFEAKATSVVREILSRIDQQGVSRQINHAGDGFRVGALTIEVLHPPPSGPAGPENVRSLVLRLEHQGHVILLTGDLEGPGLDLLRQHESRGVDVLLAPHHGSVSANQPVLARWAQPRLVVVSGPGHRAEALHDVYRPASVWVTGEDGAITIRSHSTGLTGETFRSGKRLVLQTGSRSHAPRHNLNDRRVKF
jgi:competence protein ComEC